MKQKQKIKIAEITVITCALILTIIVLGVLAGIIHK